MVEIGREKNTWQDLLEQLDSSYMKSLKSLEAEQ